MKDKKRLATNVNAMALMHFDLLYICSAPQHLHRRCRQFIQAFDKPKSVENNSYKLPERDKIFHNESLFHFLDSPSNLLRKQDK
jgi:hypothetical protein